MGLAHLEKVVLYGQPVNFFDAPYYLPLYVPVFALLFQAIFLLIVAFYFDAVIPTDDSPKKHPLFFIGMKFDNIAESLKETERQSLLEEFSQQPKNDAFFENVTNEMEADVDVFHLTKKWSKNKFGVQDITFKAYKNQVRIFYAAKDGGTFSAGIWIFSN
uniref:Uncharacterized protein n=1 Tax=Panagrolaimus davidi TaxID=227884 RepID=A0A914PEE1_9BILA